MMRRHPGILLSTIVLFCALSTPSYAASFEGTLSALVNGFVGKILPILSLGYLGKNIFEHIQNDPNAGKNSVRVTVALVALIGINAVWAWVQDKVR